MNRFTYLLLGGLISMGVCIPEPVQAQSEGVGIIEEVIVTARRRAESVRDVPGTVSVITESMIEGAGVERVADFINLTPGVTLVNAAEVGDTQVNIRGIQQLAGIVEPPCKLDAVYGLDDVEYGGGGLGLVALELADHVKNRIREIRELAALGLEFLDVAFAEMALSGVVGGEDVAGGLDLGHGHQGDFLGRPAGAAGCFAQAAMNLFESLANQVFILVRPARV